ncbi:hypothetical protein C475_18741 [Halosimplex carlsbadense 2-9-1]|uniref:Uncharacterized protein n=1 Tax=Halosimplex carlsbadense 2-9-1 TaxID=797114 RepID=M0CHY5_9EURY|nr:hypothetical protein C475_18741 [Halosimplex carlsbadense 2-9-1]
MSIQILLDKPHRASFLIDKQPRYFIRIHRFHPLTKSLYLGLWIAIVSPASAGFTIDFHSHLVWIFPKLPV